jgi:hypothetical protein
MATLDKNDLKEAVKAAIIELLEEREDLLSDAVEEALTDIGLVYAIQAGEDTPTVSRDKVFGVLESAS